MFYLTAWAQDGFPSGPFDHCKRRIFLRFQRSPMKFSVWSNQSMLLKIYEEKCWKIVSEWSVWNSLPSGPLAGLLQVYSKALRGS